MVEGEWFGADVELGVEAAEGGRMVLRARCTFVYMRVLMTSSQYAGRANIETLRAIIAIMVGTGGSRFQGCILGIQVGFQAILVGGDLSRYRRWCD